MADVLISCIILTTAILGVMKLQYANNEKTLDDLNRTRSSILANDFMEKLTENPDAQSTYYSAMESTSTQSKSYVNCATAYCSATNKAKYDVYQIYQVAAKNNISIALTTCANNTSRQCMYFAWGDTTPTASATADACVYLSNDRLKYRDTDTGTTTYQCYAVQIQ